MQKGSRYTTVSGGSNASSSGHANVNANATDRHGTATSRRGNDGNDGVNSVSSYQQHDNFDRFVDDADPLPVNANANANANASYDSYSPRLDTTPKSRRGNKRPTYADFTPKSEYAPRDLQLQLSHQHRYTKESSPTSVTNMGGVRWNKTLTQQEYILSPESAKLGFGDSDPAHSGSSAQKPKSILRSRRSSSYTGSTRTHNKGADAHAHAHVHGGETTSTKALDFTNECPSNDSPKTRAAARLTQEGDPFLDHDRSAFTTSDLFDENERSVSVSVSPIQTHRLADGSEKFPESYVHFIEAVASVVIQTKIRQKLAKIKVLKLRNEQLKATHTATTGSFGTRRVSAIRKPQSHALARRVRRREKKTNERTRRNNNVALDFYSLAAIQIQAAFRGWWMRDCMGVDNYCAAMIQKVYRGMHCRNEYQFDRYSTVLVQSVCRRWIAMDVAVTRLYCIVRIQAFVRGSLARKRMGFDFFEKNVHDAASIMIQTQWRSFLCEMNFLRAYEDILVVQSVARGWMARRRVCSWMKANNDKTSRDIALGSSRRKPLKLQSRSQNNLSPAYSSHIAYMKKALSPMREPKVSRSRPSLYGKPIKPTPVNEDTNDPRRLDCSNTPTRNEKIQPFNRESPKPGSTSRDRVDVKLDNHELEFTQSDNRSKAWSIVSKSRADNERRRKQREQETKAAHNGEEYGRHETQAAEIAEIILTRKAMSIKAEARKREDMATKQMNRKLPKQAIAFENPFEEKKTDEESNTKEIDSKSKESIHESFVKRRKPLHIVNSVTRSQQKTNLLSSAPKAESTNPGVAEEVKAVEPEIHGDPVRRVLTFSNSTGESLVAKRMLELKVPKGNFSSPQEHDLSAQQNNHLRTTKNNARVAEDKPTANKPVFEAVDDAPVSGKESSGIQKIDRREPRPDPKATRPENKSQTPKRSSKTSATYKERMRSLRSGSEQKRIDGMNNIFRQAGLLSRVKRSNVAVIEDGTILKWMSRD